jgi:hypothetical protein
MAQDHLSTPAVVSLTPEALQAMIAAAVTAAVIESRKPNPPTAQELSALQMAQEHRAQTAQSVLAERENKIAMQNICAHEHSRREGGGTHAVWVREENPASPGFILCQKCQGRIRPGHLTTESDAPAFLRDRGAIYNTDKFNKLFQDCGEASLMG